MKYSDTLYQIQTRKSESPEICIQNQAPFRLLQLASFAVYISMLLIIVGIMFVPYGKSKLTSYFRHNSFMQKNSKEFIEKIKKSAIPRKDRTLVLTRKGYLQT